ncbi:MAG: DUF359 domain-containing protein [ANME-2 cluster archaeon]|nr:DUF359 domain-containing protein [ANME-2 cluster archaeon]
MLETILGKTFCLPESMRHEMRKQFGVLYPGNSVETTRKLLADIGNPAKLIVVGDISTFNMLLCDIVPDISFVDEKTHRVPAENKIIKGIRHPDFREVHVKNPAGCVTHELVSALTRALDADEPVQIMVEGEEDLAALPAIVLAPPSSVVIYGLPDEGAIMVKVTSDIKTQIYSMLERMASE